MTVEVTELKPCPFCGATNTPMMDNVYPASPSYGRDYWRVVCDDCSAEGPRSRKRGDDGFDDSITLWNTRASDARIAELEAKVEQLECALRQIAETPNYRCFAASMRKIARAALGDK